jgi:ABC-2 type transport system permease protein
VSAVPQELLPLQLGPRRVAATTAWRADLRAVRIVVHRELIRYASDRPRTIAALFQPLLFLFVLGTGLTGLVDGGEHGDADMRVYMFAGVIALTCLFTALFSAVTIVQDREFGFLREMLAAPVRRAAVVIGKCLGGTIVATIQGLIVLALAPLAGVPYDPVLLLTLFGEIVLLSFSLTAFGMAAAVRLKATTSFMTLVQMVTMPMFFLSGAVFPLEDLPRWLTVATELNPLTYAVDPMRQAVLASIDADPATEALFAHGPTWGSWLVPVWAELLVVTVTGLILLAWSIQRFRRD